MPIKKKTSPKDKQSIDEPLPWMFFGPKRFAELRELVNAGNLFALLDAVDLARGSSIQPRWLRKLASASLVDLICVSGAAAKWQKNVDKYKRALRHLDRWQAVYLARKAGTPWEDVWEEAAKLLEHTTARGSADAIRKSYQTVNAGRKDSKTRHLYYPVRHRTRARAGILLRSKGAK